MTFVAMTRKQDPASLYVAPALLAAGKIGGAVGHLTLRGKKGGMETDERVGGGERGEWKSSIPSLPYKKEVPSFPLLLLLFLFPMGVSFPHLCEGGEEEKGTGKHGK